MSSNSSFQFTYLTSNTSSDPGTGNIKLNSSLSLASAAYIDILDTNSVPVTGWLSTIATSTNPYKGYLRIYSKSNPSNFGFYRVVDSVNTAGYYTITLSYVTHNGTLTATTGDTIVEFTQNGNRGNSWMTGATAPVRTVNDTALTAGDMWLDNNGNVYQYDGNLSEWVLESSIKGPAGLPRGIVTYKGNHTLTASDAAKFVLVDSSLPVAITLPKGLVMQDGTETSFIQLGTGAVTFTAGVGVVIRSFPGRKIAGQNATVHLTRIAPDSYVLHGALSV